MMTYLVEVTLGGCSAWQVVHLACTSPSPWAPLWCDLFNHLSLHPFAFARLPHSRMVHRLARAIVTHLSTLTASPVHALQGTLMYDLDDSRSAQHPVPFSSPVTRA